MITRNCIGGIVALAIASSTYAAPPSVESVEKLLTVTRSEKMLDSVYASLEPVMRATMAEASKGQTLSAEQQRVLELLPANMSKVMREELNWEQMRPLYVQIYQESLTQEEVAGLVAFYESPAGVAMVNKMPVLMQKSMSVMQSRLRPLMEKIKNAVEKTLAEAKAAK